MNMKWLRWKRTKNKTNEELEQGFSSKYKWKIAVVGMSQGVGATFVATSLAFLLSKKVENGCVAYVELEQVKEGAAMTYFSVGLDRCFQRKVFTDFFETSALQRKENLKKRKLNYHKGINWVVRRYQVSESDSVHRENISCDLPLEELVGSHIVVDRPEWSSLLRYDLIIAVVSPRPSRIFAGLERYEELRDREASGLPVIWVLNGTHEKIDCKQIERFFKQKHWSSIGLAPTELFDCAEFMGKLPIELLENTQIRRDFDKIVENVWEKMRT